MKKTYYYSLLQYSPSLALAEKINVGIFYIFVEEQKLILDIPNHLQRVKDTFPHIDLNSFKMNLKRYAQIADAFRFDLFASPDPKQLIHQLYGQPNSTSLQFCPTHCGLYQSIDELLAKNQFLYFQSYLQTKKIADTQHILTQLELLFDQNNINRKLLKNKPTIADIKFDYSWKNGATNFIKPLSFDYQLPAYIGKKANEWIGKIVRVKEKLFSENLNLDFFTSPPQKIDFKPIYQDALQSLKEIGNQTEQRVHFYESKDIPEYVANLAAHIHS